VPPGAGWRLSERAYRASAALAAEGISLYDAKRFLLAERRAARRGRPRGDRSERHPQRLPDVDRSDGHDFATRGERISGIEPAFISPAAAFSAPSGVEE
jgi:hypothetical protein